MPQPRSPQTAVHRLVDCASSAPRTSTTLSQGPPSRAAAFRVPSSRCNQSAELGQV